MSKVTATLPARKPDWKIGEFSIPRPPVTYFKLSPHASGKWQRKINGKVHYFGTWARLVNGKLEPRPDWGWQAAWDDFRSREEALTTGREPQPVDDRPSVGRICNLFLDDKLAQLGLDADEIEKMKGIKSPWKPELLHRSSDTISGLMVAEYKSTADRLVEVFGHQTAVETLGPDDFTRLFRGLEKRFGPVRRGNEVQKIKTVFKWAAGNRKIPALPYYGTTFRRPTRKELKKHRAGRGKRTFDAAEIHRFLDAADPTLKAMIYLGINAAFGNTDVASLPLTALDLTGAWVEFARGKTGEDRKAKLWPETADALRAVIDRRPVPADKGAARLVFLAPTGKPWQPNHLAKMFGRLAERLGINGGRGFYTFRHTFRSVADAVLDTNAIRRVMGHTDGGSIDGNYTHFIADSRLEAVAAFVRGWLFGQEGGAK
jgi:integrase